MGFYNMLFGENPIADILLKMLDLERADLGRYRDCYLNKEGTEIIIYTRNGGLNRNNHKKFYKRIVKHSNYLRDKDDSFDNTYAEIFFSVPKKYADNIKEMVELGDTTLPKEKWECLLKLEKTT